MRKQFGHGRQGVRDAASQRCAAGTLLVAMLAACSGPSPGPEAPASATVVWPMDGLEEIGGHPIEVAGSPRLIETPQGRAIEFDGEDDALFVEVNPLAGAASFTIEVVFRPDPGGSREQRLLHVQETGSEDRALVETRLPGGDIWFLDTYVESGGEGHTLFARRHLHPLGRWYHAALVVDGREMRHYVDGRLEISRRIAFSPQGPGRTSIGVRINRVDWFRGAVREVRFSRRALSVGEFSIPDPR